MLTTDEEIEELPHPDSEQATDLAALTRLYPDMDEEQFLRAKGRLDEYVALIVRTYRRKKIDSSQTAQPGL